MSPKAKDGSARKQVSPADVEKKTFAAASAARHKIYEAAQLDDRQKIEQLVEDAVLVLAVWDDWMGQNCPRSDFAGEIYCEMNYALGYIDNEMGSHLTDAAKNVTERFSQYYDEDETRQGMTAVHYLDKAMQKIGDGYYRNFCYNKDKIEA